MKLLVCVKQVPETETAFSIGENRKWVTVDESSTFRLNRFDECAMEEALTIRDGAAGSEVHVLSVGGPQAAMAIKRALGMGGDRGIHLNGGTGDYFNPLVIAGWIASYARDKGYDLIFTGMMSEDTMQGQVGPMLAELLGMPHATSVVLLQAPPDSDTVYVEREVEGGFRECMELTRPAVVCLQTGINKPRYPSLPNILKAKKQKLEVVDGSSLETVEAREDIVRVTPPPKKGSGIVLQGSPQEKASALADMLREKSLLSPR